MNQRRPHRWLLGAVTALGAAILAYGLLLVLHVGNGHNGGTGPQGSPGPSRVVTLSPVPAGGPTPPVIVVHPAPPGSPVVHSHPPSTPRPRTPPPSPTRSSTPTPSARPSTCVTNPLLDVCIHRHPGGAVPNEPFDNRHCTFREAITVAALASALLLTNLARAALAPIRRLGAIR